MKAEKRIAFVIGNGDYDESPLKSAVSNAQAMQKFLKKQNFTVVYKENATKRDIIKSMRKFNSMLGDDGVALFYFYGHFLLSLYIICPEENVREVIYILWTRYMNFCSLLFGDFSASRLSGLSRWLF